MANPKRLSPSRQQELVQAYNAGDPLKKLQADFGVSASTIRSYVLASGGTLRNVGRPRKASA